MGRRPLAILVRATREFPVGHFLSSSAAAGRFVLFSQEKKVYGISFFTSNWVETLLPIWKNAGDDFDRQRYFFGGCFIICVSVSNASLPAIYISIKLNVFFLSFFLSPYVWYPISKCRKNWFLWPPPPPPGLFLFLFFSRPARTRENVRWYLSLYT